MPIITQLLTSVLLIALSVYPQASSIQSKAAPLPQNGIYAIETRDDRAYLGQMIISPMGVSLNFPNTKTTWIPKALFRIAQATGNEILAPVGDGMRLYVDPPFEEYLPRVYTGDPGVAAYLGTYEGIDKNGNHRSVMIDGDKLLVTDTKTGRHRTFAHEYDQGALRLEGTLVPSGVLRTSLGICLFTEDGYEAYLPRKADASAFYGVYGDDLRALGMGKQEPLIIIDEHFITQLYVEGVDRMPLSYAMTEDGALTDISSGTLRVTLRRNGIRYDIQGEGSLLTRIPEEDLPASLAWSLETGIFPPEGSGATSDFKPATEYRAELARRAEAEPFYGTYLELPDDRMTELLLITINEEWVTILEPGKLANVALTYTQEGDTLHMPGWWGRSVTRTESGIVFTYPGEYGTPISVLMVQVDPSFELVDILDNPHTDLKEDIECKRS